MKVNLVALDYDGTVARRGVLDPAIRPAAAEARERGISVVLVTGRILAELRQVAGTLDFVDAVVAENGAVLAFPDTGYERMLADPPPPAFVQTIQERGIVAKRGQVVLEADSEHGLTIEAVIQEQELPLALTFNRDRVMALPQAVNKATGLRELLRLLRRSEHNAVGIGDAENDHALLAACEIGGAVAWGSPLLQAVADIVVPGDGPGGVAAYLHRLAAQPMLDDALTVRHRVTLGTDDRGQPVTVATGTQNVLVTGERPADRSAVTGLLAEQLILQRYSVCILDAAGEQRALAGLPGVMALGGDGPPPTPAAVANALRYADTSLLLDLTALPPAAQPAQVSALLSALARQRRQTGWPHRVVVDVDLGMGTRDADAFEADAAGQALPLASDAASTLRLHIGLDLAGTVFTVARPSDLPPEIVASCNTTIQAIAPDEALLYSGDASSAAGPPVRVRLGPRLPIRPPG